jgi:hypothetical protein
MIKMYVNQFAISIFGFVLAMATIKSKNNALTIGVSAFAVVFYLFLIYTMTWEIGAKDKISVDVGKKPYRPHTGALMSLIANIPNYIIAILYLIGYPNRAASKLCSGARLASLITEGMYLGIIRTISINGKLLHDFWWTYFIITIPAIFTSWLAYYLGHRNFRFFAGIGKAKPDAANKK